jgi:flagellar basal-body rod modification protein FlgD
MSISSLLPATEASPQAANHSQGKKSLTQGDFLNLFVTQMRFQNPLEPMDNNQMATQLAQFNSVEALNTMTHILETMTAYQASMSNLNAAGLIGKKVEANGSHLSIEKGNVSEGYYQLSKPGKVTVQIRNAQGHLIRILEEGPKDASKHKIGWDGKDQKGVTQPDGAYTFQVTAGDGMGKSIPLKNLIVDLVKGVSFENGVVFLNLGAGKITVSDIIAILA